MRRVSSPTAPAVACETGRKLAPGLLLSRPRDSRHNSRAGHPGWLRCSSLKYSRYSRSSRLAIRAPRSGIYATLHGGGTTAKLRLKPTSYRVDSLYRIGLRRSFTVDVGTDVNTGVFLAEYHHRPSRQGGSDDAQHRHYYQGSRDTDGPLPRSHLSARLHAQAADIRRTLLFLARPSRPSHSVARIVSSHA